MDRFIMIFMHIKLQYLVQTKSLHILFFRLLVNQKKIFIITLSPTSSLVISMVDPVLEKKIRNKNYFFYIVWYEFEKLKYFEFLIL